MVEGVVKLTTQEFAAVLERLVTTRDNHGSNKRTVTRVEVAAPATVWWLGEGGRTLPASWVHVFDVSLTGAGIIASRRVKSEETFILGFARHSGSPLLVSCRGARCVEIAEGVFRIGAPFRARLTRSATMAATAAA